MNKTEIKKVIKDLEASIKQLADKKNKLFFFVADSKGAPIGSLSYIYPLAYQLKEMGYNVQMLYSEKDFVGVGGWLGEKYAALPHYNAASDIIDVSPSDILFIPELFSSVMSKTKELHCKKVAILENFDYLTELIPLGSSWETLRIHDCITTSEELKERLLEVFPRVKVYVIRPVIDELFKKANTEEPRDLIVNILSKDAKCVNSVIKPFKWRHPEYGFVSFRYINGRPKEEYAEYVAKGEITVWIDPDTDFGYSALEAMACKNIVIGKIPENIPAWMVDEEGKLRNNGVWFYNMRELPDILANVLNAVLHESVPQELYDEMEKTLAAYTQDGQNNDIVEAVEKGIIPGRTNELTIAKQTFKNNLDKAEDE